MNNRLLSAIILLLYTHSLSGVIEVFVVLKYIHVEKILLVLATTLVYLNRIQHVSHHSIANARAVLPASSKKARIASVLR